MSNPTQKRILESASTSVTQKSIEQAATINASAGIRKSTNYLKITFSDLNGDGLPDMINHEAKKVSINLGYSFSPEVNLETYQSNIMTYGANTGLGVGVELFKGSVMAGFGISNSMSSNNKKLIDMNGDGLLDIVSRKTTSAPNSLWLMNYFSRHDIYVRLNNGNGFNQDSILWASNFDLESDIASTKSINASGGYGFPIAFGKIVFNLSTQYSNTLTRTLDDIRDYDGDGFVDFIKSDLNTNTLYVSTSNIRRTNKLKSVSNPLGGKFEMDYVRTKSSSEHPGGKWVMSKTTINDGISDDGNNIRTDFEYENGKYNRREREFCGFGKMTVLQLNTGAEGFNSLSGENQKQFFVKKTIQVFDVSSYYTKGNLLRTSLFDSENKLMTESENLYYAYDVRTRRSFANGKKYDHYNYIEKSVLSDSIVVFSPLKYTKTKIYNGGSSSVTTNQSHYSYWVNYHPTTNQLGDLKMYKSSDKGSLNIDGSGVYDYQTEIWYKNGLTNGYFYGGIPTEVKVTDGTDVLKTYRHIRAYYTDNNFPTHLTRISQKVNQRGDSAVTTICYDKAGNIIRKVLPSGMAYNYTYDDRFKMYLTQIKDTFGYESKHENYDYRYGIPLKSIDKNGNSSSTTLDNLGRISTITGPNEYSSGSPGNHTIKFEYYPHKITRNQDGSILNPAYAITKHFDPQHLNDSIVTVNFVDGFGRSVQVKKDASINGQSKMTVSGRVRYDAFGREVESYYPTMDVLSNRTVFNRTLNNYKTTYTYDALDRITKTILPDNTSTSATYTLDVDNKLLVTTVTDALLNDQITYTNGSGLTVKTVQFKDKNTPYTTSFLYDAVNQPVETRDAAGKTTTYIYDLAGRRIEQTHPASGKTTFEYDPAGNLISKQTANLAKSNKKIQYFYKYNRLDSIVYPFHPENNVKYTYGSATDASGRNRKGRIVTQEDGSGVQEFSYGKMGELTQTKRSLVIPNHTMATYTTSWQYDSWNRLLNMTFPDGEIVNYSYDTGGQLSGITASKDGANFTYLDKILYDEFEQRSYIRYGNGAETSYTYKPDNRLLNNLKVNSGGIQMMNNTYSYDSLQNITQVLNNGSTANTIGGGISYNYHYDKLNRLDSASGEFTGYNGKKAKYTLSMAYDNMHNITRKKQDMVQSGLKFAGMLHAGEELNYMINADNCQQIRNIAESSYRQASPATAAYQTGLPGGVELKQKTEEYGYDANGNLLSVLTGTHQGDNLQVTNSRKMLWDEENRLQAVSDNGFVSNYYYDASGERTVKLSGASQGVYVNGALNKATTNTDKFTAYINPNLVLNSGGYYSKHIYAGTQRILSKLGSSEIFHSAPTYSALPAGKLTVLTATIKSRYDSLGVAYHGSPQGNNGFETSASGKINTPQLYFYHPDHLGSSSLITDNNGLLVQHLQYLPFGEVFIDERKGSWHTPFTFSAKEQDEETGLHFFGARYYDSRTGTWLSVDPLAEKYPNFSSYVYCYENPLNVTDPDGREGIGETVKKAYEQASTWAANNPQVTARVDGALKLAGGLVEGVIGLAASCAGVPAGPAALAHGSDVGGTGINQLISGQFQNTAISGALQNAGVSAGVADAIDAGVGAALTAGASVGLNAAKNVPAIAIKPEERVFWSGGDVAKKEAMQYAKKYGMKTLEMTPTGKAMNTISPYLPRKVTAPVWDILSSNFAKGAKGTINVFHNEAGVSMQSTWRRIEYPILKNRNIIYHPAR